MRVLLAADASPDSRNAAQVIKRLVDPPDLDVLNVVDVEALQHAYISPSMPPVYYETYRKEVSEAAERMLHELRDELAPYAAHIRLIADTGDAAESIIQTAHESKSQLVVMGQRGMTANFELTRGQLPANLFNRFHSTRPAGLTPHRPIEHHQGCLPAAD